MIKINVESESDKRQRLINEALDSIMDTVSKASNGMLQVDRLALYAGINKRLLQRMNRKERKHAITVNKTGWEYCPPQY